MAIAVDSTSSTNTGSTLSHNNQGSILVAIASLRSGVSASPKTSTVTYAGTGMTKAVSLGNTVIDTAIWYLTNPTTGTNAAIFTFTSQSEQEFGCISLTGGNVSNPIVESTSASLSGVTSASIQSTAVVDGIGINVVAYSGSDADFIAGTGSIERWDMTVAAGLNSFGQTELTSLSSVTMNSSWGGVGVSGTQCIVTFRPGIATGVGQAIWMFNILDCLRNPGSIMVPKLGAVSI